MALVVYTYDQNDNILAQFLKVTNFQCRQVINDIGSASFELDLSEEWVKYDNLKEYSRCKVSLQQSWTEKTIFEWVIRSTSATTKWVTVTLNDFLYLLKKKKLYADKNYTATSVATILSDILGEINGRYNTNISLSTTESAALTKSYKAFISFFDVLQDLVQSGYEYQIIDRVLYFKQQIWTDKTASVEFEYNVLEARNINIADYSISRDSESLSNAVTATSTAGNSTQTDATSISAYGRIEEIYPVDWDATNSATQILGERKTSVSEISVTPITKDYFIADIGDTVQIYIDGGNEMQFFSGNMRIVEKSMTYSWAVQSITLNLSTTSISTMTLLDVIKDLRERVKKIEV